MAYGDVDKQETQTRREAEEPYRSVFYKPEPNVLYVLPSDMVEAIRLLKIIAFSTTMSFWMLVVVVAWICHLWVKGA